jgi:arsenate reductase
MVKIFHNPKCGTSRNTLTLIRNSGVEPEVVLYLETPPSKEQLKQLIADMDIPVRDVLRQKGTPYEELDLGNAKWSDEEMLDFMMVHPILINRPIVVTARGTRLCRPSEVVLEILVNPQLGAFTKEDGEVVINEKGERVKAH